MKKILIGLAIISIAIFLFLNQTENVKDDITYKRTESDLLTETKKESIARVKKEPQVEKEPENKPLIDNKDAPDENNEISESDVANNEELKKVESKVLSDSGLLSMPKMAEVMASQETFDDQLNQLEDKSLNSLSSIENKSTYEYFFYQQKEYIDGNISINKLSCGEKICMASLNFENEDYVDSFVESIQSSTEHPIKSATVGIGSNNIANLIFHTDDNATGIGMPTRQ